MMQLAAHLHWLLAVTVSGTGTVSCGGGLVCNNLSLGQVLAKIAQTIAFLVGAVAIIMVIVGGFRYVVSAGNPQATKEAKDTILSAVVGVIIALAAYAIIGFVIGRFQ